MGWDHYAHIRDLSKIGESLSEYSSIMSILLTDIRMSIRKSKSPPAYFQCRPLLGSTRSCISGCP
jgi:hypothetical protein